MAERVALAVLYMALGIGDLVTTHISVDGGAHEMNPVMRALLGGHGADICKLGATLLACLIIVLVRYPAVTRFGWLVVGFYAAVVLLNVGVIASL